MRRELDYFKSQISLDASHVTNWPPVVILCGGKFDQSINHDIPSKSVREHLYRSLLIDSRFEVYAPETFKEWNQVFIYTNLIEFELDFAYLARSVVLVLESEGSLAELGVFCNHDYVAEKMTVLIQEHNYREDSFIKLGPLQYLDKNLKVEPLVIPWGAKGNIRSLDGFSEHLDVVSSTLRDGIQSFPARTKFKVDNKGHVMFLIVELINIAQAVKESEIRYFLEILSLSAHDLKRMLFILQCVDLIGREDYSGETFYAPRKKSIPRISFSANKERTARFDRDRLISTFSNYANSSDSKRNFVIKKRAQ